MKILLISPAYPPASSGEAEHCFQIAQRLGALGHATTVLTNLHPQPTKPAGFQLRPVMRGWRWRDLARLAQEVLTLRPDAVVLIYTPWLYGHHPMITFFPTVLGRLRPGAKLLALLEVYQLPTTLGRAARLGRKAASWMARTRVDYWYGTLLSRSHAVAGLGPTIIAGFAKHDPDIGTRGLVIPPPSLVEMPADPAPARERTRAELGTADSDVLLAYFGYVYAGKGVETLVHALALLRHAGVPARVVMAGGGRDPQGIPSQHEAAIHALAKRLGVAQWMAWPAGYEGGTDTAGSQLLAADLAVLPFDDGAELRRSSIAVVASMGLPLITTTPSHSEAAFIHESNVLLCPPKDPGAVADAVLRLMKDPPLRARLRSGARTLASQHFSWEGATATILGSLAAGNDRAA